MDQDVQTPQRIVKKSIWIAIIAAILIITIGLTVVFRMSIFEQTNKDLASVKNNGQPHTDAAYPAYYRVLLTAMCNYADSLGMDDDFKRVLLFKTYDSLAHQPNADAAGIKTSTGLYFNKWATQFLFVAAYGKPLDMIYNGVNLNTDSARIVKLIAKLTEDGNWQRALESVEPATKQYRLLRTALNRMNAFVKEYPAIDSVDTSSASALRNNTILKLQAYGLIKKYDSVTEQTFSSALYQFQKMVHADTTGKLDKATIVSLQFPLLKRIAEIKSSLNFRRWSSRLAMQPFVFVNVAAARLTVIGDTGFKVSMRVIPGEPDDKTPFFTAYFTKVTTYPYWVVPFSIETKEMLPRIQKSTDYLKKNNLEVLDQQGNVLDYTAIHWGKYSKKNFRFIIRQQSGCNDALGILQFSMNCPFDIYLHDTDVRELFSSAHRFLSHGCVRVQEPLLLAKYLLDYKFTTADSIYVSQCLKGEKPKQTPVVKKVAAVIYYLTAEVSGSGELRFYKDIYDIEK